MNTTSSIKSVATIIDALHTTEGGGFNVQRPFPTSALTHLDPFLLLDEMGPMDVGPGEAKGAPDHPHRGFETVTYMLSGEMEHEDSAGNSGKLEPGDVQWMTAGSGVIHSELPSQKFLNSGGRMHGVQLWVNLPSKDKMTSPHYQEIDSTQIPTAQTEDGLTTVKVIAGESLGATAVIKTKTPIIYLHVAIQPGGTLNQNIPSDFNSFAYILDGSGYFDSNKTIGADGQMVIFNNESSTISITNPSSNSEVLDLLLIAGKPLNEPIARYGPFVMNTEAEIYKAISDFRSGRFGNN